MQKTENQKDEVVLDGQIISRVQLKSIQKKCNCGAFDSLKPKLPAGIRRKKIQSQCVERIGHNLLVPMILLQGVWLRNCGFESNRYVIIEEGPGRLVIRVDQE